jgi:hypothetical protein
MLKTLTIAGSLVLASSSFAQQTMQAQRVPSRAKEAGVYHLSTRTWSHNQTLTPSQVIYRNDANTGFFGVMGAAVDLIWTDEGCIPGTSHEAGAQNGPQTVQNLQLKYCSTVLTGFQLGGVQFYDSYTSCTDPIGLPVVGGFGFSLPGGTSGTACWIVTFDLTGTTFEFPLTDDADGVFDGTTALDNFGWTLVLQDGGSGGFNGPFLDGDPNNFAYGDGTYYQAGGYGTGLGTRDQFWISDPTATYANGCYWFGGYPAGAPFGSFSLVLGGKSGGGGGPGTKYCVANNNSTGNPADLSSAGSASSSAGNLTLTSAPVPNQNSIFFHAANQAQVPFGCSFLCATGNIIRGAIVLASSNSASYTYNNSDAKHNLGGFVGQTRNFQHWYRDPMGAGSCASGDTFNTSNAMSIAILP